ncbi:helix-turn-helix domain-containing protein [Paenibacillus sp. N3.4]|uniref:helix-turn-helix domain-containing protein n=1 Tax=Paenibacillus sp. N3.4 TaxID=2603222 RepID=UPI0011C77FE6|nr:AraC family transcriptional regulator [Paenibacillus sp. N3.4]TXK72271.1 helix-turn-helix transcriptional regulator [Paenibacillus sp. N3.4]
MDWITSYFSYHLSNPLNIDAMAKRAHLSPSRFNDVFKRQYGVTPHQYLLDMRINHACELLHRSELSQEQITQYCGFSNIHHFSKTFKKKKGKSPGAYRKLGRLNGSDPREFPSQH